MPSLLLGLFISVCSHCLFYVLYVLLMLILMLILVLLFIESLSGLVECFLFGAKDASIWLDIVNCCIDCVLVVY